MVAMDCVVSRLHGSFCTVVPFVLFFITALDEGDIQLLKTYVSLLGNHY